MKTSFSKPSSRFFIKPLLLLLAFVFQTFFLNAQISCPNLVTNGDFEAGNTGFTSDLTLDCNRNSCSTGAYCVTTNFNLKCNSWPNFADHTPTGVGNFLAIDGSTGAAKDVWRAPVTATAGTPYTFSFWYASIYPSTSQSFDLGMMVNGTLVHTITVSQVAPNVPRWVQYTFNGTLVGNNPTIAIRQLTPGAFRDFGLDDIVFSACPPPTPKYCCDGKNLITNGHFNDGNVGFIPGYSYDGSLASGSCPQGEYNVVTGPQATTLNGAWQVQAPSCSPVDKFLLVNGGTTGAPKLVWKSTISVKAWGKYKFCFNVKNLGPSEAKPPIIEVKFPGSGLAGLDPSSHTINVTNGLCVYQTVNRAVDLWGTANGNVLNIEIWLNENPSTAPNDLAFDNIALIEVPQCPVASAKFDFKTIDFATYYNVEATAIINGPCTATWWEVCEIDPNTLTVVAGSKVSSDTKNWWTTSMKFDTYNGGTPAGIFQYGKLYRITRGTWGDCNAWNSYAMYVASSLTLRKARFFTEQDIKANKSLIQETMKSK